MVDFAFILTLHKVMETNAFFRSLPISSIRFLDYHSFLVGVKNKYSRGLLTSGEQFPVLCKYGTRGTNLGWFSEKSVVRATTAGGAVSAGFLLMRIVAWLSAGKQRKRGKPCWEMNTLTEWNLTAKGAPPRPLNLSLERFLGFFHILRLLCCLSPCFQMGQYF